MDPPSSPSYTVSSPRRTLSLLKKRRPSKWSHQPSFSASGGAAAGPKPAEVYGFVGAITTVIATGVFLVWAYTPEPWLHWLGITYYPSKYWALAVPTYFMVVVFLAVVSYLAMNFIITPPPTSLNTIFDEYSREPMVHTALEKDAEPPIEPISDLGIGHINDLMFRNAS